VAPFRVSLEVESVSHYLRVGKEDMQILKDVSCSFKPGDLTAILGPSGAGKTTFLNVSQGVLSILLITGDQQLFPYVAGAGGEEGGAYGGQCEDKRSTAAPDGPRV
jgi:ABC-type taurine transport system ATPase subunit